MREVEKVNQEDEDSRRITREIIVTLYDSNVEFLKVVDSELNLSTLHTLMFNLKSSNRRIELIVFRNLNLYERILKSFRLFRFKKMGDLSNGKVLLQVVHNLNNLLIILIEDEIDFRMFHSMQFTNKEELDEIKDIRRKQIDDLSETINNIHKLLKGI